MASSVEAGFSASDIGVLPQRLGFRSGDVGTHTSRTMMLSELCSVLDAEPAGSKRIEYIDALVEQNITGKKTVSTRRITAQRLSELYALDPTVSLFQLLRLFWDADRIAQPLLALLCACARDPLLRITAPVILTSDEGAAIVTASFDAEVQSAVGERFKPGVRNQIARNAASSWTQSGHLQGRTRKIRSRPVVTPSSTAYAVALAYLSGLRGNSILTSFWVKLLDQPATRIHDMLLQASRRGWLKYRSVGQVLEISFPPQIIPPVWSEGGDEQT